MIQLVADAHGLLASLYGLGVRPSTPWGDFGLHVVRELNTEADALTHAPLLPQARDDAELRALHVTALRLCFDGGFDPVSGDGHCAWVVRGINSLLGRIEWASSELLGQGSLPYSGFTSSAQCEILALLCGLREARRIAATARGHCENRDDSTFKFQLPRIPRPWPVVTRET